MPDCLPGTALLDGNSDRATEMVAGIDRYLLRALAASVAERRGDLPLAERRAKLRRIVGAADARVPVAMEYVAPVGAAEPGLVGVGAGYRAQAVRWAVFGELAAEGLLLVPDGTPVADVIALGDCAQTPELVAGAWARRLAESGCRVLIPTLVDRETGLAGVPGGRVAAVPHREFIYRAAYEMGRHLIGIELQAVFAAIDWLSAAAARPLGLAGWGEGAWLGLFAAALDERLQATWLSGHFGPRETLWQQPIDRNVWSLLKHFGDAELAAMVAPRTLVIEAARAAELVGRPYSGTAQGPTPGDIATPPLATVQAEVARAAALYPGWSPLLCGDGAGEPGGDASLAALVGALGGRLAPDSGTALELVGGAPDAAERQRRLVTQAIALTQRWLDEGEARRAELWAKAEADAGSVDSFVVAARAYREHFHREVIGALPEPTMPANPRSRRLYEAERYTAWEVQLDVFDDVFAYGILLVPKDLRPGERRPVVVTQHGLEGLAEHAAMVRDDPAYRGFGCKLAERGFVVFAPQNPYRGFDLFRTLQRKANPLGLSLFSFIVRQHERIVAWLGEQPFVDAARIGFYGISYGGKTAMRVPAIVEGYALSICSADYNEWVRKNAWVRYGAGYLWANEYEMFEFDLGNTYNYAEMSWLIFPRPFMVERGHHDGVATDDWVGYEYAKTFRRYNLLGLPDRCEIEWFDGPHTINGQGSYQFLHRWLDWPER